MSLKTKTINRLLASREDRESYIRAKLNHLLPSQIRALRLRRDWTQIQLGKHADMKQARISAVEKPGAVAFTLDTLIGLASAFKVGLQVKFVPLSQMLDWEKEFSQDRFNAKAIEEDLALKTDEPAEEKQMAAGTEDDPANEMAGGWDSFAGQNMGSNDNSVGAISVGAM
jgi:transcriptional regulator with XRE-family HTH domain